jgi:hypothetical protein
MLKMPSFLPRQARDKHREGTHKDIYYAFLFAAGSPEYYLNVTQAVQPHPLLYMSVKHTQLDFWRYSAFNPCLGACFE